MPYEVHFHRALSIARKQFIITVASSREHRYTKSSSAVDHLVAFRLFAFWAFLADILCFPVWFLPQRKLLRSNLYPHRCVRR